jgi:RNA polymerase sigma-70 factor (ECF subfamily)
VTEEERNERDQVRRAQAGDRSAFEWILRRYLPLVGSVAYSVVGDRHVAEDIAQDTFHKAYRRIRSLRDPGRFGPWVYGIARTTAVDWLRKNRGGRPPTFDIDHAPDPADTSERPDEAVSREEEKEIILRLLFDLPENYREVLVMKHMRDLSYAEVARLTGTTVPAVESLLFRARAALRERLKRRGIG